MIAVEAPPPVATGNTPDWKMIPAPNELIAPDSTPPTPVEAPAQQVKPKEFSQDALARRLGKNASTGGRNKSKANFQDRSRDLDQTK